jgi:SAM-dependent methyltransferase
MEKILSSKNYTDVSNIYEHIMRKVRYDYWADYIYAISSDHVGDEPKVLELASGNCNLACFLSAYYPKLIATDLSYSMLNKNSKARLKKVCCDMTMIPFNSNFDLIVSAFDSINYLITEKKLSALFNEVCRILSSDGIFTFDVSLEKNSYRHIKDPVRNGSYKGIKYRQETDYDSTRNIHRNVFYITYPNGNVFKEVHIQKIYSFETYFDLIDTAGLSIKECYEAFTFKDGSANSPRVQFIAVKK